MILAGPDDDPSSNDAGWLVGSWDGKKAGQQVVEPRWLARLDLSEVKQRECDKELKPEALTLLEETADQYRLLILSDGMCDGGPLAFKNPAVRSRWAAMPIPERCIKRGERKG